MSSSQTWQVQTLKHATPTLCSAEEIRRQLELGQLSGSDWIRSPGSSDWVPLITVDTFRRDCAESAERDIQQPVTTTKRAAALCAGVLVAFAVGLTLL